MIGKIFGIIEEIEQDYLLIKTISGISYIVYCASNILYQKNLDDKIELFIQTHITENKMDLYGFIDKDEKKIFNLLNSVKSVGKKTALNILSKATKFEIQDSLIKQDTDLFKKISGIGKNTAERIISELKNKISHLTLNNQSHILQVNTKIKSDAVEALIKLGIKREEAYQKVKTICANKKNIELNDLIKFSLQSLQK